MPRQNGFDPDRWVDEHGDALYRFALVRVRDAGVAEELVQETFLAGLRAGGRFAGASSERTWLVGILKHKIVDHFRRAAREPLASDLDGMPDDDLALFEEPTRFWNHDVGPREWGADPETAHERARFWRVLDGCLAELPARVASAFTLREVDGLDTEEICKVLGVRATNLWVMLHRARAHLRLCLEKNMVGKG